MLRAGPYLWGRATELTFFLKDAMSRQVDSKGWNGRY